MAVWSERDLACVARLFGNFAHPLRLRVLLALEHETLSPTELAQRFGVSVSALAYHVRALRDAGLLELVDTRLAGGSVQSFYGLSDRGRAYRTLLEVAYKLRGAG